jgi:hypothetical protein
MDVEKSFSSEEFFSLNAPACVYRLSASAKFPSSVEKEA